MLTAQSIAYLKQSKMLLKTYEEVETELRMAGWSDASLEEVRHWYHEPLNDIHDAHMHGHNVKRWQIALIVSACVIWIGTLGFMGMVAYDKLSTGSPQIDYDIARIVFSLPFMPKTVRYVLSRAVLTSGSAKKATVDASMAVDFNGLTGLIGTASFDAALKGPFDFTDVKNPAFSFNLGITQGFNADVRTRNHMVYWRVNKLPLFTANLFGKEMIDKIDGYLGKWIMYDATPMETEARKQMDATSDAKNPAESINSELMAKLVKRQILPKIVLSSDKLGSAPFYKLHLTLTKDIINALEEEAKPMGAPKVKDDIQTYPGQSLKTADYIDSSSVDVWIDKSSYYIGKILFSVKTKDMSKIAPSEPSVVMPGINPLGSGGGNIAMVMAISYSDYGKTVKVDVPTNPLKFEDVYKDLATPIVTASTIQPDEQLMRLYITDIEGAASRYYATTSKRPSSISDLVAAGELSADVGTNAVTQQIMMMPVTNGVFIFSSLPASTRPLTPFYGVVVMLPPDKTIPVQRYFTQEEVDILLAGQSPPVATMSAGLKPTGPAIKVTANDHVRGSRSARYMIVEYSDYECPFCKPFNQTLKQITTNMGGSVAWVYRHFPLAFHTKAEKSAEAAECAADEGNESFWLMSDAIYMRMPDLNVADLPAVAKAAGVRADITNCLNSGAKSVNVALSGSTGQVMGISGTPTTFIVDTASGRTEEVDGAQPYDVMLQKLNQFMAGLPTGLR